MSPPKETVLFPLEAKSPKEPLTPPPSALSQVGRRGERALRGQDAGLEHPSGVHGLRQPLLEDVRGAQPLPALHARRLLHFLHVRCALWQWRRAVGLHVVSRFLFLLFSTLCVSHLFSVFFLFLCLPFFSLSLFFVFVSSSFFRFSLSLYLTAFHLSLTSVFALLTSLFSPLFLSPPTLFSLSHSRYLSLSPTLLSLSYSFLFSFR